MTTFESFKDFFKKAFFSIPIQIKIKEKWQERRYTKKDNSLEMYFAEQLKLAQYFEPKMINFEVNFKIAKQLPWRAREALAGADFENTSTIISRLQYLDLNPKDDEEDHNSDASISGYNYNDSQIRKLTVRNNDNNNKRNHTKYQPSKSYKGINKFPNQQAEYSNRGYQQTSNREWGNRCRIDEYQNNDQYGNNKFRNNTQRYSNNNYSRRIYPVNTNDHNTHRQRFMTNDQRVDNNYNQQSELPNIQPNTGMQSYETPSTNTPWLNRQNNGYAQLSYNHNTNMQNASQDFRPSHTQQNIGNRHHLN